MPTSARLPVCAALAALLLVLAPGAQSQPPRRSSALVRCSPTVLHTVQRAAEDFMRERREYRVCVLPAGPRRTRKAVSEGTADLGIATLSGPSRGLKHEPLGREALALVVHPSNPVDGLDLERLAGLFSGAEKRWQAVGGPPGPVHVYGQTPTQGLYDILMSQVLGPSRAAAPDTRWVTDSEMVRQVSRDPLALGYLHLGHVTPAVKVLAVEGVVPSADTVRTRVYPVHQDLELLMGAAPGPAAQAFALHLTRSERGDRALQARRVVPLP